MNALVEFLLARIAEDEAAAQAATPGPWTQDGGEIYAGHPINQIVDYTYDDNADHIARWDPARVLAECEAKRRIVAWHRLIDGLDTEDNPVRGCGNCIASGMESPYLVTGPCMTVRLLALPYADHPDYREEWRP